MIVSYLASYIFLIFVLSVVLKISIKIYNFKFSSLMNQSHKIVQVPDRGIATKPSICKSPTRERKCNIQNLQALPS